MQKNSLVQMFRDSVREFQNIRSVTMGGLLIALNVLLGFFGQFRISDVLEVRFDFLSIAIAGMLLGPAMGAAVGGLSDIVRTMIKGNQFFPGFTLNQILLGFLFGILLYQKFYEKGDSRLRFVMRVVVLNTVINLGLNLFITTYWLHIMYGSPYAVLLVERLLKEVITLPVNCILCYVVLSGVREAFNRMRKTVY